MSACDMSGTLETLETFAKISMANIFVSKHDIKNLTYCVILLCQTIVGDKKHLDMDNIFLMRHKMSASENY